MFAMLAAEFVQEIEADAKNKSQQKQPREQNTREERPRSMIRFWCMNCGKTLEAHAEHAGKKCKCPRCGQICSVPVTQSEAD